MIENAKVSDIDDIIKIERKVNLTPWSRQMFSESLNDKDGREFFLSKNPKNQIMAYLIALEVFDEASLLHIAVDPDFQSQGIARQLIQFWLGQLSVKVKTVWLEVRKSNEIAQSLYLSCGFVLVDERKKYYRLPNSTGKETALIYCLTL